VYKLKEIKKTLTYPPYKNNLHIKTDIDENLIINNHVTHPSPLICGLQQIKASR